MCFSSFSILCLSLSPPDRPTSTTNNHVLLLFIDYIPLFQMSLNFRKKTRWHSFRNRFSNNSFRCNQIKYQIGHNLCARAPADVHYYYHVLFNAFVLHERNLKICERSAWEHLNHRCIYQMATRCHRSRPLTPISCLLSMNITPAARKSKELLKHDFFLQKLRKM